MPRPRFNLRWLMLAVAVVGLACGGEVMRRRADKFTERAAYFAREEQMSRWGVEALEEQIADSLMDLESHRKNKSKPKVDLNSWVLFWEARLKARCVIANQKASLRRKYERAARYPWLPVAPDPPEPK